MIKILKEYFSHLKIIQNKRDKLVPVRGTLSIAKAKKLIGFKSRIPFEIGFRRYIKWYKSFYKRKIINEH